MKKRYSLICGNSEFESDSLLACRAVLRTLPDYAYIQVNRPDMVNASLHHANAFDRPKTYEHHDTEGKPYDTFKKKGGL